MRYISATKDGKLYELSEIISMPERLMLFGREIFWAWLGTISTWAAFVIGNVEAIKTTLQILAMGFSAGVGAVTFGYTIWKWRRDIKRSKKS